MKISIITNGSIKMGMGHIYRTITLAKEFRKFNVRNILFITKSDGDIINKIKELAKQYNHKGFYKKDKFGIYFNDRTHNKNYITGELAIVYSENEETQLLFKHGSYDKVLKYYQVMINIGNEDYFKIIKLPLEHYNWINLFMEHSSTNFIQKYIDEMNIIETEVL